MLEPFKRRLTIRLTPLSMTPLPIGRPSARNMAYCIRPSKLTQGACPLFGPPHRSLETIKNGHYWAIRPGPKIGQRIWPKNGVFGRPISDPWFTVLTTPRFDRLMRSLSRRHADLVER